MGFFDFLDRFFRGTDEISLKTVSREALASPQYKILVVEAAINLIAKTFSLAEFQTFEEGEETRKRNYYLYNIEANQNLSSPAFWRRTIRRLIENSKALVLVQNGQFFLADSFEREEFVFKENIYREIIVDGYLLEDVWRESNVLYLEDNFTKLHGAISGVYSDFAKLIAASSKGYRSSKSRKGKLKIPTKLPKGIEDEEALQKYIRETLKEFMDPDKDTVYPESGGFVYEEIKEGRSSGAHDTGRDTRKFIEDVLDFVAMGFGIPPSVLTGEFADTKDAVANFLSFGIKPFADLVAAEINRKMYGLENFQKRTYMRIDTTNIKTLELKDIANSIDLLNRNAALTIDDILRYLGKEPLGGEIGSMRFITKNYELLDYVLEKGSIGDSNVTKVGGGD